MSSPRFREKLRAEGKCVRLCFGRGNPPAGMECQRKVVPGSDYCKVHQEDYVRPKKGLAPVEQVKLLKRLLDAGRGYASHDYHCDFHPDNHAKGESPPCSCGFHEWWFKVKEVLK